MFVVWRLQHLQPGLLLDLLRCMQRSDICCLERDNTIGGRYCSVSRINDSNVFLRMNSMKVLTYISRIYHSLSRLKAIICHSSDRMHTKGNQSYVCAHNYLSHHSYHCRQPSSSNQADQTSDWSMQKEVLMKYVKVKLQKLPKYHDLASLDITARPT